MLYMNIVFEQEIANNVSSESRVKQLIGSFIGISIYYKSLSEDDQTLIQFS